MQVNPISSTNYQGARNLRVHGFRPEISRLTKFRLPLADGGIAKVTTEENEKFRMTKIAYDIIKNKKVVESKVFENKKGMRMDTVTKIVGELQAKVKEGFDFFSELINAQIGLLG